MKTKLGISVGLLAAITCWCGVLSGYLAVLLLVGYVLLREEDGWLKGAVVKVLITMVLFDVLVACINLVPSVLGWVSTLTSLFNNPVYFTAVNNFIELFTRIINIAEKVFLLLLGLQALKQKSFKIPVVDDFIAKHV